MPLIQKILRQSIKFFASIIIVLALCVAGLYGRLAIGPIDLSFLQPLLQRNINHQHLGFELELKNPVLKWQGWGSAIEIAASDIEIQHLNDQIIALTIPEVSLRFRLRSLLQAQFIPASLIFTQPKLIIKKSANDLTDNKSTTSPQDFLKFILPLIDPENNSRILKSIHFNQANLSIQNDDGRELWSLSNTNFTLERRNDNLLVCIDLQYDQQSSIILKAEFADGQQYWQGSLKFVNINPALLCAEIKAVNSSEFLNDIFARLPVINSCITGQINGKFINFKEIIDADITIESGPGQFKASPSATETYVIDHLLLKGQFINQDFTIDALEIRSSDGLLQASGQIVFDPSFHHCIVDTQLTVEKFDIKYLSKYWPVELVPEARSWVVNNVRRALIPKSTLSFKGKYDFNQPDLTVIDLKSTIYLEDATLYYMDDMAPITNIMATANIDLQKININVASGRILDDLRIKQAVVEIDGLDKANQHINISNVDIEGPTERIIEILNAKPLKLLQKYNITPENTKGYIHTLFNINFPLNTKTIFEHLKFDIHSTVENLSAVNTIGDIPINLSQGQSQIQVNDRYMLIESDVRFNDNPTHIYWKKFFIPKQKVNSHLVINTQLSADGLKKINPDIAQAVNGQVDLNIQYDTKDDKSGIITIDADLNDTELNIGGWKKLNKKPCMANAVIELQDDKPIKLQLLQLKSGNHLNIKATGSFDDTGLFFKQLSIPDFKIGHTNIKAQLRKVKDNSYKMHIDGDKIDLKPHMNFIMEPSKNSTKSNINFDLIINVKEIALDVNKQFYDNDIKINLSHDKLNILSYVGLLQKQSQQYLYINLFPHDHGRRIIVKCSNTGALLRSLQIFENFHKGNLKLAANHDDRKGKNYPWDGKLVIENFRLGQVPFLGRLFSLAAPTGFGDLFSNGNKMSFDILKIKFKFNSDKLIINSGRAHGPSIGITVAGALDKGLHHINMYGSILPAYFINTLISKIPLLGQLISGGKYEGIFGVSYKIAGTRDKPDIIVNPLSVLTPGLFRQLFSPVDNKINFDDDLDTDTPDGQDDLN